MTHTHTHTIRVHALPGLQPQSTPARKRIRTHTQPPARTRIHTHTYRTHTRTARFAASKYSRNLDANNSKTYIIQGKLVCYDVALAVRDDVTLCITMDA